MIKRILVPTDGSDNSLTAADYAVAMAGLFKASIKWLFVKDVKVLTGPLIHDIGTSIGGMVPYGTFNQTIREMPESQADAALALVPLSGSCPSQRKNNDAKEQLSRYNQVLRRSIPIEQQGVNAFTVRRPADNEPCDFPRVL